MGEGHRTQQSSTFQERRNGAWYSAKHRKWCQLLTASSHTFTVIISSSCQPCINTQAWAAEYWYKLGLPKQKLNVGLALYGRSFTLSDPYNNGVGAPAKGKGNAGNYTREAGFLSYFEVYICSFSFLFNEVSNSKVWFKHQREAMDATFKWIFKRKSTLSVLGLPEDLRGSPKTLHSWAGVALHYVRWPVGGVRWCRQPGSKGKWLQSRGNTIRNYKSSSKCLTNAAYCCANFVIYKSFKFTEFTNKQLSITPSQ